MNRSVITIATKKRSYLDFAFNMAQSVLLHNIIDIYIISDLEHALPSCLKDRVTIIRPQAEHAALGIGMKLYIDLYVRSERTLYLDADCLCYGSLDPIFEACADSDVSVAGTIVDAAAWVGVRQAQSIRQEFGWQRLIRFNGGMYYLKNSMVAAQVYELARAIIPHYDRLGFQRLSGDMINEEGPLSIGMMQQKQQPLPDRGLYMTDLFTDPHPLKLNVLTGVRQLVNPPPGGARHRPWYPVGPYSPIVLHFGGNNLRSYTYCAQATLLKLYRKGLGTGPASVLTFLVIHIPFKFARWLVASLRR